MCCMSSVMPAHEPAIRLTVFVVILIAMAVWEAMAPRRLRLVSRWVRWPGNLGIVALNTVVLRAAFPVASVGFAAAGEEHGWGLLNIVTLPGWAGVIIAVLLLDLAVYLQHVMFHAVPALWRLHRMHHTDLDFDVTTGARFHPLEILLSMGLKLSVIAALGAPAFGVLLFEVILSTTSMFNHGNVSLPERLNCVLRWIVVTPDMHRVHHSASVTGKGSTSPPSRRQLATWAPGRHSPISACSRWRPSFSCPDRSSALPAADCSVRYGGRPMLVSAPPSVRRWRSWLRATPHRIGLRQQPAAG